MYIFNRWPRVFLSSIFFWSCTNLPQFKNWLHSDFLLEISFFSDKLLFFVSINKNGPPYLVILKVRWLTAIRFFVKTILEILYLDSELAVGSGEDIVLGRNSSHSGLQGTPRQSFFNSTKAVTKFFGPSYFVTALAVRNIWTLIQITAEISSKELLNH